MDITSVSGLNRNIQVERPFTGSCCKDIVPRESSLPLRDALGCRGGLSGIGCMAEESFPGSGELNELDSEFPFMNRGAKRFLDHNEGILFTHHET